MAKAIRLDRRLIWYKKGAASFHRGDPRPRNTWSDQEWHGALNEGQCFWLGYMVTRGINLYRKMKHEEAVRDYIEHGFDLPPDFQ